MSILESYINNPSGEVFTIARESRSALVLSLCLPDTVEWSRSEGTINNQWMVSVLHKANFSDPEQTECSQETLLLGPTKNTRNHRDRVKRGLFILSIELYLHLNFMVLTLKSISVHVPNIWWVCKTVVVVVNFYNFIVGKKLICSSQVTQKFWVQLPFLGKQLEQSWLCTYWDTQLST